MAITLSTETVNRVDKMGSDQFTLAAGKTLKIKTSPNGNEILEATVPDGKTWDVQIWVVIEET